MTNSVISIVGAPAFAFRGDRATGSAPQPVSFVRMPAEITSAKPGERWGLADDPISASWIIGLHISACRRWLSRPATPRHEVARSVSAIAATFDQYGLSLDSPRNIGAGWMERDLTDLERAACLAFLEHAAGLSQTLISAG